MSQQTDVLQVGVMIPPLAPPLTHSASGALRSPQMAAPKERGQASMQFEEGNSWREDFAGWLRRNDRMPKTVDAYLQDVRHFSKYFERVNRQVFSPDQLNATDVRAYFADQDQDKAVAPSSRNRRLASLRVLVEWSVEVGFLEYDPTVAIKREPVELTPRDRTPNEMECLNAVVQKGLHVRCATEGHSWLALRDRMIWLVFTMTGLRIHEVAGLDVGDLDFERHKVLVLGKGGKKAKVDVSVEFMQEVISWLNVRPSTACQALITDRDGKRITTGQIRRRIQLIGNAAGVKDLNPHDLRHTYAYAISDALKKQGLPETAVTNGVRKQLRHGDEKTTRLYFGVRDSQIRAAVEAM